MFKMFKSPFANNSYPAGIATGSQLPSIRPSERLRENPFGSSKGANHWEAGNMAKALLGRTDYRDGPIDHFRTEFNRDPDGAQIYTAAVYEAMDNDDPEQAHLFASRMNEAGLGRGGVDLEEDFLEGEGGESGEGEGEESEDELNDEEYGLPPRNNDLDQLAGNLPQRPQFGDLLDRAKIIGEMAPRQEEETSPGLVEVPDGELDAVSEAKLTASALGLNSADSINDPVSAAAVQGVANYRFLNKANQEEVMLHISTIEDKKLRAELLGKIAEIKVLPELTPRAMTDQELREAVGRNEWQANLWKGLSKAPGYGVPFDYFGGKYQGGADRMREELIRRGMRGERY